MKRLVPVILLCASSIAAQAQVYKWVDEKGKVHYGDRPIAKEIKDVPVLREAKAKETLPTLGMKLAELKRAYGEPDRTHSMRTSSGETLIWTYRRSKTLAKDFVVRIEGGEVVEVANDLPYGLGAAPAQEAIATSRPMATSGTAGTSSDAAALEAARTQEQAANQAATKKRLCDSLKAIVQNIESAERRGGSGSTMDSLREQKRGQADRMAAEGCGFL